MGKNKIAANLFEGTGPQQRYINISHLVEYITGFLLIVKPKEKLKGVFERVLWPPEKDTHHNRIVRAYFALLLG